MARGQAQESTNGRVFFSFGASLYQDHGCLDLFQKLCLPLNLAWERGNGGLGCID